MRAVYADETIDVELSSQQDHATKIHSHRPYFDLQESGGRMRKEVVLPAAAAGLRPCDNSIDPGDRHARHAGRKEGISKVPLPRADLVDHFGKRVAQFRMSAFEEFKQGRSPRA